MNGWRTERAKWHFQEIDERAGARELPLLSVSIHRGVTVRDLDEAATRHPGDLATYKVCVPGDVVINRMRGFQGAVGLARIAGIVSPEYLVLRPRSGLDPRFFSHLIKSTWFVGEMTRRLRGIGTPDQGNVRTPRVNVEAIGNIVIPLPILQEQRAIADFLDRETTRIDALVSRKSQVLSLLIERLASRLDHLVWAQGDPLIPLRHLVKEIVVGIVVQPARWYVEKGGVPAVRAVDMRPFRISTANLVLISEEGHRVHPRSELQPGDVMVVRTGEAGAAAVVPPALIGGNCISNVIIRPSGKLLPAYLEALLNSHRARSTIREYSVGAIQQHFGVDAAKRLRVPAISYRAQQERLARATRARASQEAMADRLERQVSLLVERRNAVITAAVTGQLDAEVA